MKIEKVNDNQIRCTLTRQDLADRQIKLSELAYGSDKARSLFKDMIEQANYEFGFETNDIPLMVEAIPVSGESIILLITKVEYPEELDTRFSKFSEAGEEYDTADDTDFEENMQGADDILDIFKSIKKEYEKHTATENEVTADDTPGENKKQTRAENLGDLVKMFEFRNLDEVCRVSKVLNGFYQGRNDLYKDTHKNRFYLMLHKSGHTPVEFNKICNAVSEYAYQRVYTAAVGAYFGEHGKLIIQKDAVQKLASL